MKGLNTITAGVMAFILAISLSILPVNVFAATKELQPVSVSLVSNVISDDTLVLYKSGDEFLLKLSDIAKLTGTDLTYEPVKIPLTPTYAIFSFGIDKDFQNGEAVEVPRSPSFKVDFEKQTISGDLNTSLITLVEQGGDYYIQAFPLLSALGAVCEVNGDHLSIIMPLNSFWEAMGDAKSGYSVTKLTRQQEFGDQTSAKLRVAMDVFVDLFTPGGTTNIWNPIGNISSIISNKADGTVLENAMYEPIDQYGTVKQAIASSNLTIDNFAESTNFDFVSGYTTMIKELSFEFYVKELIAKGILPKRVSHDNILEALIKAEDSSDYNLLKKVDQYGSAMDIAKIGLEFGATLYHRIGVETDRINALEDTFAISTLKSLPNYEYQYKNEPRFFSNARSIAKNLSSKENAILLTTAETGLNVGTELLSKIIIEQGVEKALSSVLGNIVLALQIEGIFIKLIIPGQINAAESDIYLYLAVGQMEYDYQIAKDFASLAQQESFQKADTLAHLRNSYIVYYQTLLHAQKLRLSMMKNAPERYGGDTKSIQSNMEKICNKIAGILHKLYSAQPVALISFASLVDQSSKLEKTLETILTAVPTSNLDSQYASVLKEYRNFATEWSKQNFDYIDKINQPWKNMSENSHTEEYGYAYRDIDGNGIQELIILTKDMMIYGIYTHADGQPILLGNYWSRYTASLDGSNFIYADGGTGMYQYYEKYRIASNGKKLELVENYGYEYVYSDGRYLDVIHYYYIDIKDQEKILVTKDWFDRALDDSFKLEGKDGLKFIPLKKPIEIKEDSGGDMYSSYAFLSSFNPSTGIAKFDFIKVVENDEEGLYEYINNNKKLREVNLKGIEIIIDGITNYYITGNEPTSDFKTDLKGFRKLYSLDRKEHPDWGWLYNCLYYITVDKNGKPVKIKTTWRS